MTLRGLSPKNGMESLDTLSSITNFGVQAAREIGLIINNTNRQKENESLTRRDREVVDFTRSRVKNKVRTYHFGELREN